MTREIGVADAARNNTAWCDAVCRAHGRPGELTEAPWLNRSATPAYYPNLVTLDRSREPAMAAIRALDDAGLSGAWAVKDNFGALSLDRAGFRILFEAEWIVCAAREGSTAFVGGHWRRVESEAALRQWEDAWGETRGRPRIFAPALLGRREVAILAAFDGDAIVAGVVANRTDDVVGMTNLFTPRDGGPSSRASCVQAVRATFPGLSLVGYEATEALAESEAIGFERLGSLKVWSSGASS